jgi:hypothetical protein
MTRRVVFAAVVLVLLASRSSPCAAAVEVLVEEWSVEVDLPTALAMDPKTGHSWIGGESINCGGWYMPDNPDSIIVSFPPESERQPGCSCDSWCSTVVTSLFELLGPYIFEDFRPPVALSANTVDGSCWLAEPGQILHVGARGDILAAIWPLTPHSVSVNSADGSCWAANGDNEVMHINSGGSVVWRSTGFNGPMSVSVNQKDGSCWVADSNSAQVVHLSKDGAELWRGGTLQYPSVVSVNSTDGSCWVADPQANGVIHLSSSGQELWRGSFYRPRALAVNPNHGDCWIATEMGLLHINPDGTERFNTYEPCQWTSLSVSTADDSVCIAQQYANTVANLRPLCSPFEDVPCWHWAVDAIVACYDVSFVLGYVEEDGCGGSVLVYRPKEVVTRNQMAVYISRGVAGGDAAVPPGPYPPTFSDVPWGSWGYRHIEYAVTCNIVKGYEDLKYHPFDPVTRDQMAVYIARAIVDPTGDEGLVEYTPPETLSFPDITAATWGYKHIEYLSGLGVVKGYEDKKYHPEMQVTRDQMAAYIARAFKLPIS